MRRWLLAVCWLPLAACLFPCYVGFDPNVVPSNSSWSGDVELPALDLAKSVSCNGICVVRVKISASGDEETVRGCQSRSNRAVYPNYCLMDRTDSYVMEYFERAQNVRYFKYCCSTAHCNTHFTIIQAKRLGSFQQDEHLHGVPKMQLIIIIIGLALVCLWPPYYIRAYNKLNDMIIADADSPLEPHIINTSNPPPFHTEHVSGVVIGQLSLKSCGDFFVNAEQWKKQHRKKGSKNKDIEFPEISYKCLEYQAGGNGHGIVKAKRDIFAKFDSLVYALMEHGPYMYNFKPIDLVEVFDQAKDIFASEPNLLSIQPPCVVIGDIRGQYSDLHRWLQIVGHPPRTRLLFLGGILDRSERGSLDCMAMIAALKIAFPSEVFVIRGVGETIQFPVTRFEQSVRNNTAVRSSLRRMCSYLPIAAKVGSKILCVHSGLCHQLADSRCFQSVCRPFEDHDIPPLAQNIIFNSPTTKIRMYKTLSTIRGELFGHRAVERICHDMKLELVIRARNMVPEGICFTAKNKMISLWSAPAKDKATRGCVLEVAANGQITIHALNKQEVVTLPTLTTLKEKRHSGDKSDEHDKKAEHSQDKK